MSSAEVLLKCCLQTGLGAFLISMSSKNTMCFDKTIYIFSLLDSRIRLMFCSSSDSWVQCLPGTLKDISHLRLCTSWSLCLQQFPQISAMANSLTSFISLLKQYLLNEANPDREKEEDCKHSCNLTIKLTNISQKENYYVI